MVCEEEVVNWFQGLKGHQRIPILRQLVQMCHPLELRFIASCVEDACRTDCLTMRSAELNANTQNVLKMLASPLDVEARSKIIVYLCLLNSTNKLCSRILSQKICDHESVTQFCDVVHKQLKAGELPSTEEQRTLDELRLLYLLASLHPSFDFIERQHYRAMCSSLNDIESELKRLQRMKEQKQMESMVPKPGCDGGSHRDTASKSCSLCFSTSAYEHICKLRLLPSSGRQSEGDNEIQVNMQWSTGKFSKLVVRDAQLRQLHARLEAIISQPRLPPFPRDTSEAGQMNSYLQHLQGLSAHTWPRSEPVYQFFRQLADEQEQRGRCAERPHSVYTPRPAQAPVQHTLTNGLPHSELKHTAHKLTMPVQNGSCAESGDDSSESSPAALDGDSELRSCTIYNSSIANGRAGSHSPLPISRLTPARSITPEQPPSGWSSRAGSRSPGPPLTNGVPRVSRPPSEVPRGSALRRRGPKQADPRADSVEKELPRPPSGAGVAGIVVNPNAVASATVIAPAAGGGAGVPAGNAGTVSAGSAGGAATVRDRTAGKTAASPRVVVSSAAPAAATAPASAPAAPPVAVPGSALPAAVPGAVPGSAVPAAVPGSKVPGTVPGSKVPGTVPSSKVPGTVAGSAVPGAVPGSTVPGAAPGAIPGTAIPGGTTLQPRIICTQTAGLLPAPGVPLPGHPHPLPSLSAVTAQNATAGTPAPLTDGSRHGASSDPPLVFTALPAGSPPPGAASSNYRPPPRSVGDLLSAGSSPSPPAPSASPASLPPPPPAHLPPSYLQFSSRPPPPLPQPHVSLVYPGGGFVQHGFAPGHEIPTAFYTTAYAPHAVQYAAVPPPRAAPPPPPPPPATRPISCYNCGHGHSGRYCPLENAINDASQQNQFKMSFVSSISEN